MKPIFAQAVSFGLFSLSGICASDMLDLSNELEWAGANEVAVETPYLNAWQPTIHGMVIASSESVVKDSNPKNDSATSTETSKISTNTGAADLLGEAPKQEKKSDNIDLSGILDENTKKEVKSDELDLSTLLTEDKKPEKKADDLDLSNLLAENPKTEIKNDESALGNIENSTSMVASETPATTEPATVAGSPISTENPSTGQGTPENDLTTSMASTSSDNVVASSDNIAIPATLHPQLCYDDQVVFVEWPENLDPKNILITTKKPFTLQQLIQLLQTSQRLQIRKDLLAPYSQMDF